MNEEVTTEFIRVIKEEIARRGISIRQLGRMMGRESHHSLARVLRSPRPRMYMHTMASIAEALDMRVSVLAYRGATHKDDHVDDDPGQSGYCVASDVFLECWRQHGKPHDMAQLANEDCVMECQFEYVYGELYGDRPHDNEHYDESMRVLRERWAQNEVKNLVFPP